MRSKLLAFLFLLTTAVRSSAAPISFPEGFVPFQSIYYITSPGANGDRLIVGEGIGQPFRDYLSSLPIPGPDQMYTNTKIELAPGRFFSQVFVPTVAERQGDFSAIGVSIIDPLTGLTDGNGHWWGGSPLPYNYIPTSRIGDIFAFRVNLSKAPTPTPEPTTASLMAASVLGLAALRKGVFAPLVFAPLKVLSKK